MSDDVRPIAAQGNQQLPCYGAFSEALMNEFVASGGDNDDLPIGNAAVLSPGSQQPFGKSKHSAKYNEITIHR